VKTRIASRVGQLPGYPLAHIPRRKRELIAAGVDVIDLGAGDADVPAPKVAVDAVTEAMKNPAMHRYGFQLGLPAYRDSIVRYHQRRFGTSLDPMSEVVPLLGSKEGLAHFALAVAGPGSVAIVPEPGYACYIGGSICAGAEVHIAQLRPENDFLVELGDLPRDLLARTSVAFLNYPNNPTCAVAPRDYLERTVAVCREFGIALAYDNPYVELTYDGYVAPSILEIDGAKDVAVEFHSCSKTFAMTGWRLGWAAGNRELLAALNTIKTYHDTGAFLALQAGGAAVIDRTEEQVKPLLAIFKSRRDAAVSALRDAGFEVPVPKACMYVWIPLPEGVKSAEFAGQTMEDQGVIVLPGSAFGPSAEGYFRIALTVSEARIREACQRIGRVLARV